MRSAYEWAYGQEEVSSTDLASVGIIPFPMEWHASDFVLPDLEGRIVSLYHFRGKIVIVHFWATWCEACCLEIPSLEALHEAFRDEPFALLAINEGEPAAKVREFCGTHGLKFPVLLDHSRAVGDAFGVSGIPATYLLDRQGLILGKATGVRDWASAPVWHLIHTLCGTVTVG
jgi:peroxiredoxin